MKKLNDQGELYDMYLLKQAPVREIEKDFHDEFHKEEIDTTFYSFFADSPEYGNHDGNYA